MDYNTFYGVGSYHQKFAEATSANSYDELVISPVPVELASSVTSSYPSSRFSGFKNGLGGGIKAVVASSANACGMICAMLPENTSPKLWTALLGLTGVAVCYTGYRIWTWIDDIRAKRELAEREMRERYEYKYLDELDTVLQSTLDDVENPETANVDTIKVGGTVFPLTLFKSFSRNLRKRLIRKSEGVPVVKRVAVPANEFDWIGSYVDDMVPVGTSRNPDDGKKVIMRYDPETESFWWYCDNPAVQYKYLETVARKYVCGFNRVDVFVDVREELKKGVNECGKRMRSDENTEVKEDDTVSEKVDGINRKKVYAKFKKYNKKIARADPSISGKRIVLKAKANRYSYKGKISDFEKLFESEDTNGTGFGKTNLTANVESDKENDTYHLKDDEVLVDGNGNSVSPNSSRTKTLKVPSIRQRMVESVSWSEWKLGNFDGWK